MGFWDVRLADLEAQGEVFTQEEVEALENGGLVLHLHPLENADTELSGNEWYPGTNEIVTVPEVLQTYSPFSDVLSAWSGQQTGVTLREYLDGEYSGWGGSWNVIPSHVGRVHAGTLGQVMCQPREDEITSYVYWNCLPLTSTRMADAADILMSAAGKMLDDAGYWQMQQLCHIAYNYYDPHDAWLYTFHRERLSEADVNQLYTEIDYYSGASSREEMEHELEITGKEYQYLYERGALDSCCPDLQHGKDGGLPWRPLSSYLQEMQEWYALDLYQRLMARRRRAIARMPPLRTPYDANYYEGAA